MGQVMRAGAAWPASCLLLPLALALGSCSDSGDEGVVIPPAAPGVTADCADANSAPAAASVVAQCGTISGTQVEVDVVITDTPGGEEVISAVLEVGFAASSGGFVATYESCSVPVAGGALGSEADVTAGDLRVECGIDALDPTHVLASVTRQGAAASGVSVVGSATVLTLRFRIIGLGDAPLEFLRTNVSDGSALLRRSVADPTQIEVIGGISFSGADLSG